MRVGVLQASVLSPCTGGLVSGVPWEDLYADNFVIICDWLEEYIRRFLVWNEAMEEKVLKVNEGKKKVMIYGTGLYRSQSSDEYTCAGVIHMG